MLKKTILMLSVLLSPLCFGQTATQTTQFTNNQTPIAVTQNKTFNITLPSNATTGYSWQWQATKFDKNVVSLVTHHYVAPNNNHMIGAPGYEVWTFKANAGQYSVTQVCHIKMIYKRPWEKSTGRTKTFVIHVKP